MGTAEHRHVSLAICVLCEYSRFDYKCMSLGPRLAIGLSSTAVLLNLRALCFASNFRNDSYNTVDFT